MTLVNSLENNFEQPNTRVAEPFPLCLERPLGAVVSQSGTQFAIWAPTAEKITLRLFSRGSKGEDGDALIGQFLMRPEADGSWTYDFADNKHGLYYDFLIERDCGSVDRVADPWAHAAGVNGRRS
ncbi:pullulanase, partial [Enterococcus durans]|nr:pullulanase [Enterococcus durans]